LAKTYFSQNPPCFSARLLESDLSFELSNLQFQIRKAFFARAWFPSVSSSEDSMQKRYSNSASNRPFVAGIFMGGLLLLALGFYQIPKSDNRADAAPQSATLPPGAPTESGPILPSGNSSKQNRIASQSARQQPIPDTFAKPSFSNRQGVMPTPAAYPGGAPNAAFTPTPANVVHDLRQVPAPVTASVNTAGSPKDQSSVGDQSTSLLSAVGNAAPGPSPLVTPAPAPAPAPPTGQNDLPLSPPDLPWRLLAQLAVHGTNAATVLIQNATQNRIPDDAWQGIAATLVGETLQDGLLVSIDPTALATTAVQEGHQRLDLIDSLLSAAPEPARQALRNAVVWLGQQLSNLNRR